MKKLIFAVSFFIISIAVPDYSHSADFDWADSDSAPAVQPASESSGNGGISAKNRRLKQNRLSGGASAYGNKKNYGTRTGNAVSRNAAAGKKAAVNVNAKKGSAAASKGNLARKTAAAGVPSKKTAPASKTNYQRKQNKKNLDEDFEIDQLPLPEPPSKKGGSAQNNENAEDYADENEANAANKAPAAKENQEAVYDFSQMELTYSLPAGWSEPSIKVRGATFAMQKNKAVFVANEKGDSCMPEDVLKDGRYELSLFKERDKPSKLLPYASKKGVSGYYFYLNLGKNKTFYAFLCAGSKKLATTLTDAEDSYFMESLSALKMEKAEKRKGEAKRPTLQPVHYSTDDVKKNIR